jgi:putative DNA primase/helicase
VREKGQAHDGRELRRIWDRAGDYIDAPEITDDALPIIRLRGGNRPEVAEAAIAALDTANIPFYRRGAGIVYVARIPAKAADGRSILTPGILGVAVPHLMQELGKAARWEKFDARSRRWLQTDVPGDVAVRIAALPNEWHFKPLSGIIGTPTLRLPDGSILDQPGYDEDTGLVLFNPPPMPTIPKEPTREDAEAALALLDELLEEFPFAGKDDAAKAASRSVALSMQMTPVVRGALVPAVPLHNVKSPHPGTGKSFLSDLSSVIATGEVCPVIGKAPREEEIEKRLHTAAMTGQPIISLDNVNGILSGEFLCQLIERPLLLVRILGLSEQVKIANCFTVFANGNNIEIAEDLVRRTIQCSLDAGMEHPERRQFRRDPLRMVLADRGLYVAAVLIIVRAYICAGMPNKPPPFMSFNAWSDLVRGSLMWLGCADPVATVLDLGKADPVRESRAAVFTAIAEHMSADNYPDGYTTAELVAEAAAIPQLRVPLLAVAKGRNDEISPERLGHWLRRATDQIADGYKLTRDDTTARIRWRVIPV